MSLRDLYKSIYPDASDESVDRELAGFQNAPSDAMKKILSFIPGVGVASALPDETKDSVGQGINDLASSNTAQDASKALLSGAGGNPLSSLAQGATQGMAKDLMAPAKAPSDVDESATPISGVTGTEDPLPSEAPITPPIESPKTPSKQPTMGDKGASATQASPESILANSAASQQSDNDARKGMLEEEHKKRMLGGLTSLGAGIGDAITNASTAFGGSAHSNNQANVEKSLNDKTVANKAEFEEGLKNDPNSGLSKSYQQTLAMMLNKKADDPSITKLSAAQISQTLPEVEKFMQKKLQMEQIKATKDLSQGVQLGRTRDQRFKQLGEALDPSKQRQGAFGVSKQVFDRAERLESLASAFPDGNLDSRQVEELAIGLNAMLSGSNVGAQSQVKALVPQSAMGSGQKMAEWLLNDPRGTQQQAFVNRMLGSIGREKSTAEDQMNRTRFSRLATFQDLEQQDPGTFNDVLQSNGVDPVKWKAWKQNGFKSMSAVQSPGEGHPTSGSKPPLSSFYR